MWLVTIPETSPEGEVETSVVGPFPDAGDAVEQRVILPPDYHPGLSRHATAQTKRRDWQPHTQPARRGRAATRSGAQKAV
jgi:hypothetical protein